MAFTYTFSLTFLPSIPAGRTSKIKISTAYTTASLYIDKPSAFAIVSIITIKKQPRAATGILPIQPNTAATNAFNPGTVPIVGSLEL